MRHTIYNIGMAAALLAATAFCTCCTREMQGQKPEIILETVSEGIVSATFSISAPGASALSYVQMPDKPDIPQVMYRIKNVSISFTGDNLGLPVTSSSGTRYSLPMNVRLSASYENRWDRHSLAAAVEGQAYFGGLPAGGCSVGAEYGFNSIAALRAGYHYGSNKNGLLSYASIGAGLSLYGITVDAAYLIAPARSAMHNTFMVGIGYRF